MGVPLDHVRVVHGDTRVTPFSMIGTGGSRAASLAGRAVAGATERLRHKVLDLVAALLEASPDDLEIVDGVVSMRGVPQAAIPLAQAAAVAYLAPDQVPPGIDTDLEAKYVVQAGDGGWWTPATHCCWVDVSLETGAVSIDRYLVVEDCGSMINPAVVDGQIRGGVAQGIGGVLFERTVYDDTGQPLAGTLMDYLLPTAVEIPAIEIHHLGPDDAVGNFRGVGEGGAMVAPPTVSNAIEDALAHLGVRVTEAFLPPSRVLELAGVLR